MTQSVYAFACRLKCCDHETIVHERTRGKAKSAFLRRLDMDVEYTDVRATCVGKPQNTADIERTALYRGVPFARAGMRVMVGNAGGVIVGHNSSANFDVLFDDDSEYKGATLNCHPNWEIAYFDDDGNVLADFRKETTDASK